MMLFAFYCLTVICYYIILYINWSWRPSFNRCHFVPNIWSARLHNIILFKVFIASDVPTLGFLSYLIGFYHYFKNNYRFLSIGLCRSSSQPKKVTIIELPHTLPFSSIDNLGGCKNINFKTYHLKGKIIVNWLPQIRRQGFFYKCAFYLRQCFGLPCLVEQLCRLNLHLYFAIFFFLSLFRSRCSGHDLRSEISSLPCVVSCDWVQRWTMNRAVPLALCIAHC